MSQILQLKLHILLLFPLLLAANLITLFLLYIFAGCSHEKSIRSKSWKVKIWYFRRLGIFGKISLGYFEKHYNIVWYVIREMVLL